MNLQPLGKASGLGYSNLINDFVKDPIKDNKMTFAIDTTDLGLYAGSTKVNTIQTTLSIGDNPTVGGDVKAGPDKTSDPVIEQV